MLKIEKMEEKYNNNFADNFLKSVGLDITTDQLFKKYEDFHIKCQNKMIANKGIRNSEIVEIIDEVSEDKTEAIILSWIFGNMSDIDPLK